MLLLVCVCVWVVLVTIFALFDGVKSRDVGLEKGNTTRGGGEKFKVEWKYPWLHYFKWALLRKDCLGTRLSADTLLQTHKHTQLVIFDLWACVFIIIMNHKGIDVCLSVIFSLICDIYRDSDHNDVTKCISLEMLVYDAQCTHVSMWNIIMCLIITCCMMKVSKYI